MGAVAKFQSRYKADNAELSLKGWEAFANDDAPDWIQALRKRGREELLEKGLPTPKLERFKYFNLPAWLKKQDLTFSKMDLTIDGASDFVVPISDDPAWLQDFMAVKNPSVDKYGDMMILDAANAYFRDGIVLDVPENQTVDNPLNMTITGHHGTVFAGRTCLRVGAGSEITIIEYHMGGGTYWNNNAAQIQIGKGATVRHYRMQENSNEAAYTQNTHVRIEEGGHYEAFVLTSGAGLSRNQVHVELLGENADCHLNGINLLSGKQQGDTTITVEHQAPNCESKQNYRSVVTDQAIGTFQGKVHVHQVAQKTDGYQLSNALLLSPQATMNTKPELEIYADDVKCSHGATSGRLDEQALFYLRSRGIPEEEAKALLIQAFVSEVMEEVSSQRVREQAEHVISRWLAPDDDANESWLEES